MKREFKFSTFVGERDVNVVTHYYPGHPGCNYMPNGDPGYPNEPAELEIVSIDGKEPDLSEAEMEDLEQRVWDLLEDMLRAEQESEWETYKASEEA